MIKPGHNSVRLVAALLFACAFLATFNLATIGRSYASSETAARAYLFRGVAGLVFSRGMDHLSERINRAGVTASVNGFLNCRSVAEEAIRDYRRDPSPIILIGHSAGGACALRFAELLDAENISVSLLVTFDPVRLAHNVPLNVERYINIYKSNGILGGGDVVQVQDFRGHYASYDLFEHMEIIHINIENVESLHEQVVTKILQLGTPPGKAEGEPVPIRLAVPADASIELWDSGMPVFAHAGDTLKALATTYHVPLWSLIQINGLSDGDPLAEGQRVITPRHFVPLAAPAAAAAVPRQAPPKR